MQVNTRNGTTNPAGSPKFTEATPKDAYRREDFFCDLKKVAKKQERPSQRDSIKR
jgi:hypothetical protein